MCEPIRVDRVYQECCQELSEPPRRKAVRVRGAGAVEAWYTTVQVGWLSWYLLSGVVMRVGFIAAGRLERPLGTQFDELGKRRAALLKGALDSTNAGKPVPSPENSPEAAAVRREFEEALGELRGRVSPEQAAAAREQVRGMLKGLDLDDEAAAAFAPKVVQTVFKALGVGEAEPSAAAAPPQASNG